MCLPLVYINSNMYWEADNITLWLGGWALYIYYLSTKKGVKVWRRHIRQSSFSHCLFVIFLLMLNQADDDRIHEEKRTNAGGISGKWKVKLLGKRHPRIDFHFQCEPPAWEVRFVGTAVAFAVIMLPSSAGNVMWRCINERPKLYLESTDRRWMMHVIICSVSIPSLWNQMFFSLQ